jgi:hypothetical protein
MLAPHRVQPDGQKKLELSDILVAASLPDAVFTSAAPVPPIQAEMGGAPGAAPKTAASGKPRPR